MRPFLTSITWSGRRLGAAAAIVAGLAGLAALFGTSPSQPDEPPGAAAATRFTHFDVFVDPASQPLGAYQVDLRAGAGTIKLVGVEGGEHPAYSAPPLYDPAALHADAGTDGHIILAAFSTLPAAQLPSARTRVARLHVQITGDTPPAYRATVMAAATDTGREITDIATAVVSKGDAK